jgi:hypothetical protein
MAPKVQFLIHVFFLNKKGELLGMIPTMVPTKKKKKKKKIKSPVWNLWFIEPDLELGLLELA